MHKDAPFCYVLTADPLYVSEPRLKINQNFMEHSTPPNFKGREKMRTVRVPVDRSGGLHLSLLPRRYYFFLLLVG